MTEHVWDPALYRRFEAERTRPAHELLARLEQSAPGYVSDLGCGPGNSTQLLHQRWPQAAVVGVDNSRAMLDHAAASLPDCAFIQADISQWQPDRLQDIIYANASLQWVGDHSRLFPHLFSLLAEGGSLAIQMPDNREQPTHRLMRQVAGQPAWRSAIGDAAAVRVKVGDATEYYDLLAGQGALVDIWRTTYFHVMPSLDSIIDWLRATGLGPFLAPLDQQQQQDFLAEYRQALAGAYPVRADGCVLMAFPRLFMIASR